MKYKTPFSSNSTARKLKITIAILLPILLFTNPHPAFSSSHGQTREVASGDVFISVQDSLVQWRDSTGNLIKVLDTKDKGPTGLNYNPVNKTLFVTNFFGNSLSMFNSNGELTGKFGSGYNASPESILFDISGNVYVGQADGSKKLLKFDKEGKLITTYTLEVEERGSDWIDLAADQCTMYYTSEDISIKRFDVCKNQQLSDFATNLPGFAAYALRLLPGGGLLVADSEQILQLDSAGKIIQRYGETDHTDWFALNLDPDGKSFWSAELAKSIVYKFDIESGKQLMTIDTGDGTEVYGLAVAGEITISQPTSIPTPRPTPIPEIMSSPNNLSNPWLIGSLITGGMVCICVVGIIIIIAIVALVRSAKR